MFGADLGTATPPCHPALSPHGRCAPGTIAYGRQWDRRCREHLSPIPSPGGRGVRKRHRQRPPRRLRRGVRGEEPVKCETPGCPTASGDQHLDTPAAKGTGICGTDAAVSDKRLDHIQRPQPGLLILVESATRQTWAAALIIASFSCRSALTAGRRQGRRAQGHVLPSQCLSTAEYRYPMAPDDPCGAATQGEAALPSAAMDASTPKG